MSGSAWWWVSMAEDVDDGAFVGAAIVSAECDGEAESAAARIAKRRPEFLDFIVCKLDAAVWLPESEHRLRLLDEAECQAIGCEEVFT